MKYSQAVLVACIGGAALASAVPTRGKGRNTHSANTNNANNAATNRNSRTDTVGKKLGNAVTLGSTFALAANGMPPSANSEETTLQNREVAAAESPATNSTISGSTAPPTKADAPASTHSKKKGGKKHLTPEEKKAKAEKWKNMDPKLKAELRAKHKKGHNKGTQQGSTPSNSTTTPPTTPPSTSPLARREVTVADTPVTNSTTSATSPAPGAPAQQHPKKTKGGKKRLSPEEKKAKVEKWKNMDPKLKAELQAKHKKGHRKDTQPGSTSSNSTIPSTNPPTTAPLARREVAAADTAATNSTTPVSTPPTKPEAPSTHHSKKKGGRKHLSPEEKKAKAEKWKNMDPKMKAELKAKHKKGHNKGSQSGSTLTPSTTPETTTPPITPSVTARDLDDDLFVRAVADELEARGWWSNLKGNYQQRKAESQASSQMVARDLVDEDELEMRDFEDLVELEARGKLRNAWKAVKDTVKGQKPAAPTSFDPNAMVTPQTSDPNSNTMVRTRDFSEDGELAARDLEDLLDARDLDLNDLEVRGKIRNAWNALKDTVKGKKPDPSMLAPPSQDAYALQGRDFVDEIDARDLFDEIDELD